MSNLKSSATPELSGRSPRRGVWRSLDDVPSSLDGLSDRRTGSSRDERCAYGTDHRRDGSSAAGEGPGNHRCARPPRRRVSCTSRLPRPDRPADGHPGLRLGRPSPPVSTERSGLVGPTGDGTDVVSPGSEMGAAAQPSCAGQGQAPDVAAGRAKYRWEPVPAAAGGPLPGTGAGHSGDAELFTGRLWSARAGPGCGSSRPRRPASRMEPGCDAIRRADRTPERTAEADHEGAADPSARRGSPRAVAADESKVQDPRKFRSDAARLDALVPRV